MTFFLGAPMGLNRCGVTRCYPLTTSWMLTVNQERREVVAIKHWINEFEFASQGIVPAQEIVLLGNTLFAILAADEADAKETVEMLARDHLVDIGVRIGRVRRK